jgi:hypothetical protein
MKALEVEEIPHISYRPAKLVEPTVFDSNEGEDEYDQI